MSGIDKQRIEDYYKGGYSSEEEKYLGNSFVEKSNLEALKSVLKDQWDKMIPEESDSHQLDHLLYKINYLINNSSRKHSQPKILSIINWYARIAAVLLIPLLIYVGIVSNQKQKPIETEGWAEMNAPLGARIKFTLPDGSFGWLNSGSTIKYALNFNHIREVQLSGQAFFDVKSKDDNKFVVKTKYLDVEVKGTCFDVAAYNGENQIDITLERGSVVLKGNNIVTPIIMKPDEQISYNITNQTITKTDVTAQYFSAWKEGKLILRNASLEDLARQLGRWYNIDVRIQNAQHADFRYRATFEDENLNEVMRLLKISSGLDYKIDERVKQTDGSFSKQSVLLKVKKMS